MTPSAACEKAKEPATIEQGVAALLHIKVPLADTPEQDRVCSSMEELFQKVLSDDVEWSLLEEFRSPLAILLIIGRCSKGSTRMWWRKQRTFRGRLAYLKLGHAHLCLEVCRVSRLPSLQTKTYTFVQRGS